MYKSDFVSITQVLVYISMCYEQIISDHFNQSAQKERERERQREKYTWYEILTDVSRIKQKLDKFIPHCTLQIENG